MRVVTLFLVTLLACSVFAEELSIVDAASVFKSCATYNGANHDEDINFSRTNVLVTEQSAFGCPTMLKMGARVYTISASYEKNCSFYPLGRDDFETNIRCKLK